MSSNETMEQHINKLGVMVEEFKAIETKVPLEVKVMVCFLNMLDTYKFLVTSLKSYESTKLTWEAVTTKLFNEEFMRKERGDAPSTNDVAFVHMLKECRL